jgi:Uma2 family endonuclease
MLNIDPTALEPIGPSISSPIASIGASTTILADENSLHTITLASADGSYDVSVPATACTLNGFREWAATDQFPERGQISFSPEGLIIDMSPELLETHNYVKSDIGLTVHTRVRERKLGRFIGDRVLYTNESACVSTEPDAMFISEASMRSGRCQLTESRRQGVSREVLGSPDWIMEVVSPSSMHKDKVVLREAYFRAGVGEYWLIDALKDEIEFQILTPGKDAYAVVKSDDGWIFSPTFDCSFRLTREKRDNFWHYTLHLQEKS